jgi:hypothetical protein
MAAMRIAIPVLCLLFCGCGSKRVTQEEVTDSTGSNRLARIDRDVSSAMDSLQSRRSFDFDSLVWRTNAGGTWHDHIVITEAAFQGGSARRRWVNQIHSLDAAKGTAIIKIGEESPPRAVGGGIQVDVVYSWREWSLLTNGEIRTIQVCADPFEKYGEQ